MKNAFTLLVIFACLTHVQAQNFSELIKLVASDRAVEDHYGFDVALDGNYAIIAAPLEDGSGLTDAGAAYILERDNQGNWMEVQKLSAADPGTEDKFGNQVAISGNYAVVSADFEDEDPAGGNTLTDAGSVYVFERDGSGTWNQVQKLVSLDREEEDFFGQSIAISGNLIIVGVPGEDEDANQANTEISAGSAYIFERDGSGTWSQIQKIVADQRAFSDLFGSSVAIQGDVAIVGARFEDEDANNINTISQAGAAYVFERDGGGVWQQIQKLVASDRALIDFFGTTVAMDGNYAVFGTNSNNTDENSDNFLTGAGAAYIFERGDNGQWVEVQKIAASDRSINDWFGHSVAISGERVLIGAHQEDDDETGNNNVNGAGSVYIFERDNNGDWTEVQKIVNSDRSLTDWFGYEVAVSGDRILVGAHLEDDDPMGANFLNNAGSVYIFEDPTSTFIVRPAEVLDLALFPNPATEFVTVVGFNNQAFSIFNAKGQQFDLPIRSDGTIDVQQLSAGIYFILLKEANGDLKKASFIKQ
ncbi:MAG: T9SS type A sorting domain-containing protein [Bacteroidota bacterium]